MPDTTAVDTGDVRVQPPEPPERPVAGRQRPQQQEQPLPPPTHLRGREDRSQEDRTTPEVLIDLAHDRPVSETEATSALEWFLSEDPDEDAEPVHVLELNVGVGDHPKWITWTVRPIDTDELRRIQRTTSALRRRGRQDDLAIDQLGNLKIIIAGSVDPDVEEIARQQGVTPEAMLQKRFRTKPGLIAQMSGQIMALSGFDDEDVRDALSAKN
jgi:Phage XkdN-like tail assembly chaperone protein, TAC